MSIELINCKNPKWTTLKVLDLDENGNTQLDGEGNLMLKDYVDENGNTQKAITVDCQWSHLGDATQEFINFLATPNDPMEHGRKLYQDLVDGKHGTIASE
jgi:hypothetical protein